MLDSGVEGSLFARINTGLALCIALVSYVVLLTIYRITFHPLAKFPGPFLAKVTELYPLHRSIVGDRHLTFWRLHEKYGDFVRYGPNQISVNTATGLKTIYGFKANVQKSSWYRVFPPVKGAWSVWTCIDKVVHARKRYVKANRTMANPLTVGRRTLAHAFSDTALRDIEHYVSSNVQIFCDQLVSKDAKQQKEWGDALNMSSMSNYLTFDILAELCFGKGSFRMLTESNHRHVVDLIFHNAWRCMIVRYTFLYGSEQQLTLRVRYTPNYP